MGIDIASRRELIAAGHTEREIGAMLGADLRYLSLAGLRRAMGQPDGNGFCFACFTGSVIRHPGYWAAAAPQDDLGASFCAPGRAWGGAGVRVTVTMERR